MYLNSGQHKNQVGLRRNFPLALIFLFFCSLAFSQRNVTLSGYVSDLESDESLIGVSVLLPELNTGTITNEYGFFSLTLPAGVYTVQIRYLGFETLTRELSLNEDVNENFELTPQAEILDEVIVEENIELLNVRNPQMSVNKLAINTIKKIPAVLGEVDVIKSITLLPGVTNAGEGASGFNVRGGAADQNLILLDEAILFNSSHLFGFFSVFNPDAIKDIQLYKGGIPASYGGRASSVLNIYQKEGNRKKFESQGGIGLISSRLLLEGPLKKEKSSFLIGGRSSYAHLFLPLIESVDNNKAYFYDLNTKLSYTLNDRNTVYLSGYFGRDVFDIDNLFDLAYGNSVANFRWNHLFSNKLFSNLSLIYSDYDYTLDFGLAEFDWNLGITNFNFKYDFKHYLNDKTKLEYGLNGIYYKFDPGFIQPTAESSPVQARKLENKFAFENAVYVDIKQQINDKLSLSYGARLSSFLRLGQDELNTYDNDIAVAFNPNLQIYESVEPNGSIKTSSGSIEKSFLNIEPRIAAAYLLDDDSSVKLSYNRMAQYLHLLSNTTAPTPLDVWAPSGKYIKPQLLDQLAIGYFKNYADYSFEIEAFYKKTKNRIDYIDGANLIANKAIEQVLLNGRSRAYGLEFLLRKNKGRFKGWLAYTISKAEQKTAGRNASEPGINNGKWYHTPFDKTHDLSLTGSYTINEKWKLNTNLLFQTGQPTTYPNGQYTYNGLVILTYEARNSSRLPAYHRMDVSATYIPKPDKIKGWNGEWVFSIYNLYNRKNAQSLNFRQNIDTGQNEALKLSIFGVVGAVTYNFKF